ncbi:8194_t:CDS:2 [Ambispora gerdemannii]|uniref:8194_t:CDS:1 n=1 Tax=Ambispora gerdemannii TaxID=144530 RepID=A0A9N8YUI7_9GLOM|nr:8194_t:CDS:2 [Ambispora gerdemannii]
MATTETNFIAYCYENGIGTVAEPNIAFYWYSKSALAHDPQGEFYDQGKAVTLVDVHAAIYWYRKALINNHSSAERRLNNLFQADGAI